MRIVEFKASKMEFWELEFGDVFKMKFPFDENESILMKCKEDEEEYNAVNLVTGTLYHLASDVECIFVDATLTIKPNLN